VNTAPSGRSWLIREQISRVSTIVATNAHAKVKKPTLKPMNRSTARDSTNTRIPTPQATYLARQGKVALGGPSQTASTR
jgi:hypothetical protein